MRAYELYEVNLLALGIKKDGTGEKLTLRKINQLKKIRARNKILDDQKRALRRVMYGSADTSLRVQELERKEAELDLVHKAIEQEIEAAKISDEARAKVRDMAQETVARRLKR